MDLRSILAKHYFEGDDEKIIAFKMGWDEALSSSHQLHIAINESEIKESMEGELENLGKALSKAVESKYGNTFDAKGIHETAMEQARGLLGLTIPMEGKLCKKRGRKPGKKRPKRKSKTSSRKRLKIRRRSHK
jgi:hypothetical protein